MLEKVLSNVGGQFWLLFRPPSAPHVCMFAGSLAQLRSCRGAEDDGDGDDITTAALAGTGHLARLYNLYLFEGAGAKSGDDFRRGLPVKPDSFLQPRDAATAMQFAPTGLLLVRSVGAAVLQPTGLLCV